MSKSEVSNERNEISSKHFSSFHKRKNESISNNQERLIDSMQQEAEEYSDSRQKSQQQVKSYISTIPKRFQDIKMTNSQFPAQRFKKKA